MPAERATMGFCPQYYARWAVEGSNGDVYDVQLSGTSAHCDCKGFQYRGECKHVKTVWDHGCLWNPQWKDPGPNDWMTLNGVCLMETDPRTNPSELCRGCGEPTVPVVVAV